MKRMLLLIVLSVISSLVSAQHDTITGPIPKNNAFINFFGDGAFASVNYERRVILSSRFFIGAKIGLGYTKQIHFYIFGPKTNYSYLIVPHHLTLNIGNGKHFFEFGVGGSGIVGHTNRNYTFYPILGYRFQADKPDSRIVRLFFSFPFDGADYLKFIFIPIGFSCGIGI